MNESGKLITKAIAYKFDVLFNDGKKIACLQNGCKNVTGSAKRGLIADPNSTYLETRKLA